MADDRKNYGGGDAHGGRAGREKPRFFAGGIQSELEQIDREIVALMARRVELSAKAAAKRAGKKAGLADPALEKRLWNVWLDESSKKGLDHRSLRKIFGQLNAVGYATQDKKAPKGDAFMLAPRKAPLKVSVPGPRSARMTRMWAVLAATFGAERTLSDVVRNDPLIELIRSLNQAGAHLSWEEDSLTCTPGKGLEFEEQLIFTGGDSFNFYMILASALTTVGRSTFAGTMDLKLLDLDPVSRFLPALGARLAGLDPHNPGLPARLESSAEIPSHIALTPDLDPDFGAALALSAWKYPEGLTLAFTPGSAQARALAEASELLNLCGVPARLEEGSLVVPKTVPVLPEEPTLPLDTDMCGYLLAMPAFTGGSVELQGKWTSETTSGTADEASKLIAAAGLVMDVSEGGVRSERGPERPARIDISEAPGARTFPLAMALILASPEGGSVALAESSDSTLMQDAGDFLDRVGRKWSVEDGVLKVEPGSFAWDAPWLTPNPWYSMALGLCGWLRPGLSLINPGEMTAVWPRFWALYNALPEVQGTEYYPKETKRNEPESKRKRIRVR